MDREMSKEKYKSERRRSTDDEGETKSYRYKEKHHSDSRYKSRYEDDYESRRKFKKPKDDDDYESKYRRSRDDDYGSKSKFTKPRDEDDYDPKPKLKKPRDEDDYDSKSKFRKPRDEDDYDSKSKFRKPRDEDDYNSKSKFRKPRDEDDYESKSSFRKPSDEDGYDSKSKFRKPRDEDDYDSKSKFRKPRDDDDYDSKSKFRKPRDEDDYESKSRCKIPRDEDDYDSKLKFRRSRDEDDYHSKSKFRRSRDEDDYDLKSTFRRPRDEDDYDSKSKFGKPRDDDDYNSNSKFRKPRDDDDYDSKSKFRKPRDDDYSSKSKGSRECDDGVSRPHRDAYQSTSRRAWQKKSPVAPKDDVKPVIGEVHDGSKAHDEKYDSGRSGLLNVEPSSTEGRAKDVKELQNQTERDEEPQRLTEQEMNALGAKIVKAELMGRQEVAEKLKAKLEAARKMNEELGSKGDTVILSRIDERGNTYALSAPQEGDRSHKRKKKMQTHDKDGQRFRYFPEDERQTLGAMFEKAKHASAEEENSLYARLAAPGLKGAAMEDFDDVCIARTGRKETAEKQAEREKHQAIKEHKSYERSLDGCKFCFESNNMMKHLVISLGSKVYLSVPPYISLTEGHCLLAPIHHVASATRLDEDVWEELLMFRRKLVEMFASQGKGCVFFETVTSFKRFPHMVLECVPLPKEESDMAPMYFKKAILESEQEWAMNKKLVDLKGRDVRRAIPRELPYFAVDFEMDPGFAHVIEDEKYFPKNFAQEIVGGMLDLDHLFWRKHKKEEFEETLKKVDSFSKAWAAFDPTRESDT